MGPFCIAMPRHFPLAATLLLLTSCAHSAPVLPEQVHLALGTTLDSASVAWATRSRSGTNKLYWSQGFGAKPEFSAVADTRAFTQDANRTWYTHVANMGGLELNTRYEYYVEGDGGASRNFSFVHRRQGAPYKHIIFGDLGAQCGFSVCQACTSTSPVCDARSCAGNLSAGMVSEVSSADMMLHLGDFAYNLDTNNGLIGDQFMRNIEQIATSNYYMVSHGNHEDGPGSLAHYIERFRSQPSNAVPPTFTSANGETTNTMYFSWDVGLVHYISVSTELWFGVTDTNNTTNVASFLEWVHKDLELANKNRQQVPWIIMQGHRSVYCSCDGDCDNDAVIVRKDLEPLMMQYGVDFFINGHEHNYERSYPLYQGKSDRSNLDPKAPIYIVSGAAGNNEMHEPFTRPQPSWSAFRANTFGYSRMVVYNSSHIHWQQIATDPTQFPGTSYGQVIDDAWIVQSSHGPFDLAKAPKGHAVPAGSGHHTERQLDHWWPLLGLPQQTNQTTDQAIAQFRATHGEQAWVNKLIALRDWAQQGLGGHHDQVHSDNLVKWEDVREDGSSDGAIFKWKDSHNA